MTPWTVARQAPLSMGFPRQEYWSGLSLPLHGIFPIQGSNPRLLWLLHYRQLLYCWATGEAPVLYKDINFILMFSVAIFSRLSCSSFVEEKHIVFLVHAHSVVSDSVWPDGLSSWPSSSVHGIFLAKILESVAYSRGSSLPRVRTPVACTSCFGRCSLPLCHLQSPFLVLTVKMWRAKSPQTIMQSKRSFYC